MGRVLFAAPLERDKRNNSLAYAENFRAQGGRGTQKIEREAWKKYQPSH